MREKDRQIWREKRLGKKKGKWEFIGYKGLSANGLQINFYKIVL